MIQTLTQSKANMFFRCGEQFRRVYLEGERMPPGIALHKGVSVHKGAEYANRAKANTNEEAPIDEVTDITRDTFMERTKKYGLFLSKDEKAEKTKILNIGLNESVDLAKAYRIDVSPTHKKVSFIEEYLMADVGLDLPIAGKPDFIADNKNKDLKTSGKSWPAGKEQTEIQPTIYKMLFKENGIKNISFEYIIMSNLKSGVKIDLRTVKRTEKDEILLIRRLKKMIDTLNAGIFLPAEPGAWVCTPKWCGFYYSCPFTTK